MTTKTFCDKCGKEITGTIDKHILIQLKYWTHDMINATESYDYHRECVPLEFKLRE